MFSFFRHRWDWLSLSVGFLLGLFFGFFLRLLQAGIQRAWAKVRQWREGRLASKTDRFDQRYRQWLSRYLRGQHLAAPLFALEEILQPPLLLPQPPTYLPEDQTFPEDIVTLTVPFSPEWPHLSAFYRAPTLSLPQALAGGANLLLIGPPGAGKTTALFYLAWGILQRDEAVGALTEKLPLYLHAADFTSLDDPESWADDLLAPLREALSPDLPDPLRDRLGQRLGAYLANNRLLILLDGFDELPLAAQRPVVEYVGRLLRAYPQLRMVAAAAPDFYDGLTSLGFVPLPLAPWDAEQAQRFLTQWGRQWRRHIAPNLQAAPPEVDALLLNRWLLADQPVTTPLALTLQAWAAYAGDLLGPRLSDALEAYLRRLIPQLDRARPALHFLALELLSAGQAALPRKQIGRHVDFAEEAPDEAPPPSEEAEPLEAPSSEAVAGSQEEVAEAPELASTRKVRRLLPELLEVGLLTHHGRDRVGFAHPAIWAYLAGQAMAQLHNEAPLRQGEWWAVKTQALRFAAAFGGGADWALYALERSEAPLFRELRWLAQALPETSAVAPWRAPLLRRLADLFSDPLTPLGLRIDALIALALSGETGVGVLFRKLLTHRDAGVRRLAALGCGVLRDQKAVAALSDSLYDEDLFVQQAAALALVAVGTEDALTAVAQLLLRGNDAQRRAAAEALANHPQEGHPTLQEGATLEDLLVRRAVVYGLARVAEPWARELLEKIQLEDDEWVVRTAAAQVVEALQSQAVWIPKPPGPLHDEPWLLAFAADRGMGVPPGEAAYEILRQCLREGDDTQVLAALGRVIFEPDHDWTAELYALLYGGTEEQQEAALLALRHLAAAGVALPNPLQYGLGQGIRH